MKKFDTAVVIGRFQPFHYGHEQLIARAFELANEVVVLIGSANKARSIKNPWTVEERMVMIKEAVIIPEDCRLIVRILNDSSYNEAKWVANVQNRVIVGWSDLPKKVVLVGHKKDSSSYYLDLFPDWTFENVEFDKQIHATDIRDLLFSSRLDYLRGVVPPVIFEHVSRWQSSPAHTRLIEEFDLINSYKKSWANSPYPPTFVTADAIVIQAGHILVVRRGAAPGKGLLALPGGFVNQDETILKAALRELREETGLKVPEKVLMGSIKASKVFDAPNRSLRGRTITEAFYIELDHAAGGNKLPVVKGGDDAVEAFWLPLGRINGTEWFEDHAEIIMDMAGV